MTLKLINVLSYTGYGVAATAKKPTVTASDSIGERLLATGYFVKAGAAETSTDAAKTVAETSCGCDDATEDAGITAATVDQYTKAQLIEFAEENGVDVSKCKSKADIVAALSESLWGGTCTMSELME